MVTMAQRLEQLRTQCGLSRPALAAELGFARTAIEKFEAGRQTPTKEQQEKIASFFGVSVYYLRAESDDPTRQETWMDRAYDQPDDMAAVPTPRRAPKPKVSEELAGGTVFDSVMQSPQFKQVLQKAVLEALRSPEGQDLLTAAIRAELTHR